MLGNPVKAGGDPEEKVSNWLTCGLKRMFEVVSMVKGFAFLVSVVFIMR